MRDKKNIVVIGGQIGDEAKGKITDFLAKDYNTVVRFSGGNNCGHTILVNNEKTVLHLIPSGILHPHIVNIIATGVVVDPLALLNEIKELQLRGVEITPHNLKIAANCAVVTSIHKAIDIYEEHNRGTNKLGTTQRGIGPVNQDRVARKGIKLYDLFDMNKLRSILSYEAYVEYDNKYSLGQKYDEFIMQLHNAGLELKQYLCDAAFYIDNACKNGGVMFEGAQAALLDIDHGSYPYVTSAHCIASYAAVGSGVSSMYIDEIIGVIKAYTTRVGTGPFPTEILGNDGEALRQKGGEFGATTGRPRRVGWLDLVALKYAARINGITSLAITKLDILSGVEELQICTHYTIDGIDVTNMPVNHMDTLRAIPHYITMKGWKEDLSSLTDVWSLPNEALEYISFISKELDVEVTLLGVGGNRNQTLQTINPIKYDIDSLLIEARREIRIS